MDKELVELFIKTMLGTDDKHPEWAIEDFCVEHDLEYSEIEVGDWDDDGKYQNCYSVYKVEDKYFGFSHARSGSHFTDWYHQILHVEELERFMGSVVATVKLNGNDEFVKSFQEHISQLGLTATITKTKGWD